MTKDELIEVAKQKGLRTGNRPGREKLLQLIRNSEELKPQGLQAIEEVEI
jgi:PP-loop superfamily ATP-utilizing enzyme